MKNLLKVALLAGCLGASGAAAQSSDTTQSAMRQITVIGAGSVSTVPDIMRITLTVLADAQEASDAIRQMSAQMDKLMTVLGDAGLAQRDMQTTGLRLSQRYAQSRDGNMPPEIVGFTASSDVTIVVRDLDESGRILDTVVAAGANHINGLQFDVSERAPLLEQARAAAVADAIAKTALYAQAANVEVGAIMSIEEISAGGGGVRELSALRGMEARDVPIAAGAIEVSAQITLVTAIQ